MFSKRKLKESIVSILLSFMMMVTFIPMLSVPAYADANDGVVTEGMDDMIWSWYSAPQVVSAGDKVFWGFITADGHVGVACYDKAAGTTTKTILDSNYNSEARGDFNGVAVKLMNDNRLLCTYSSGADGNKKIHIRVSNDPLSIASFSDTSLTSNNVASYSQIVESNGEYYVFNRTNSKGSWIFSIGTCDDGTWSWTKRANPLIAEKNLTYYCRFVETTNPDMIRILMCSDASSGATEIRMGFYNTKTKQVLNADATTVIRNDTGAAMNNNVPYTKFDTVANYNWSGKTHRLFDVAVTDPDKARFIFADYDGANNSKYYLYDAGLNAPIEICSGGNDLVSGNQLGASFRGANDIIAIRNADGSDIIESYSFNGYELSKIATLYTHEASGGSRAARPIVDVNGEALLWYEGTYSSETSFNTAGRLMFLDSEVTKVLPAINLDNTRFIYNGEVQKPTVTIDDLVEGTDYELTWSESESTEPGTYTVTATGKGSYTGESTAEYKIVKATISLDKTSYDLAENIVVTCATNDEEGWVAVYPQSESSYGTSTLWYYPEKRDNTETTKNLIPDVGTLYGGKWKIVYLDKNYEPLCEPVNFTIVNPAGLILPDKNDYMVGESINVSLNDEYAENFMKVTPSAWVGLYDHPDNTGGVDIGPDINNCYYYCNCADFVNGQTNILEGTKGGKTLEPGATGKYRLVLFTDGYNVITNNIVTITIQHNYGEPTWSWSEDCSKATATFACVDDKSAEPKTVTVSGAAITSTLKSKANCENPEITTYTAVIDSVDFFTDSNETSFTGTTEIETSPKLGHKYVEVKDSAVAATCTTGGKEADQKCSACGAEIKGKTIAALGHDWDEGAVTTEPTCTDKGVKTFKCKNDPSHTRTENIDALGHKEETVPAVAATCTTAGKTEGKKCSVCGAELKAQEDIAALGHKMTHVDSKAATTEAAGNVEYWTCAICEKYFSDAEGKNEITQDEIVIPKKEEQKDDQADEKAAAAAKEILNKAVSDAKAIEQGIYSDESFKALQDAIAEAEALAADPNATPEQMKAAADKIMAAADALSVKEHPTEEYGEDGTAVGPGASAEAADAAIKSLPNDNDPAGAKYSTLKLRSSKQTKTSITLNWTKSKKASKYVIYGNACGKANKFKKLKTVKGSSSKITKITKKLKKAKSYKFLVVALDSNNKVVSTSKVIHVCTKGKANYTGVTTKAKNNKVSLKKGKTFKLKAKATGKNVTKHVGIRYESSNKKVATVNKSGKITAKKKGTCKIYAYAQNGVRKIIKVTVK